MENSVKNNSHRYNDLRGLTIEKEETYHYGFQHVA